MSQEFEEQQRLAYELKEQLKSLEEEERSLIERVKILEAKLEVQDLLDKVRAKRETNGQLRNRIKELEERLKSQEKPPIQAQLASQQEGIPREHF
ncbi:MAG: hypothetical protein NWE91_03185 [Candidatus Bathyarchaeota archaeon]|nr:hypothetical protein [Candidatus Bathyarchaeota archaeon]